MHNAFRAPLLAGAAALLLQAAPARAADVTEAQARDVEAQLRTWLSGMLGPSVPLPPRPVMLTPAGDHFNVVVPFKPQADAKGSEIVTTAAAQPLPDGKWSITGIKTTNPVQFTIDMPAPPNEAGKPPSPATIPVTYDVRLESQDGTILFDPTLNTPSTTTSSVKGVTMRMSGAPISNFMSMAAANSVATLRPAGPGRVDFATDATLQDYRASAGSQETGPIDIAMKLVRVNMGLNGVDRTRATILVQTLATAVTSLLNAPANVPPEIAPELGKQLLAALQDVATEINLDETVEGIDVKTAGIGVQVARAKLGFGAKADAGLLQARMEVGAEGLVLPDLGLGPMMAFVPTRFGLRPYVTGVNVAALTRVVQSSNDNKDPAPQDIQALFSRGSVDAGLESLLLELAGATFTGQGKLTLTSPQRFNGSGQVTAANFDALMDKVANTPEAAQAVPVLTLAKGMARVVDNKLVWNISYENNKLLVNNVDLMRMMGGGNDGAAAPRGKPNRQ